MLLRKGLIETIQEYYMLSWTNAGSDPLSNSSWAATCLPSHRPSKLDKEKQGQSLKQCSQLDFYTWTCQCWLTSKYHVKTGCSQEGMPGVIGELGWMVRERVRELWTVTVTWWLIQLSKMFLFQAIQFS